MILEDTIVATVTPPGYGGVAILRLSGSKSLEIASKITLFKPTDRTVQLKKLYIDENKFVDQGLVIYFKSPRSFTGEDVVEIQTHGGPILQKLLIDFCLSCGARHAEPGEFSYRAFMNNKVDLVQAEAISSLIHASTEESALASSRTLSGEFSTSINSLSEVLISARMYMEAAIDFSDEDIDLINNKDIITFFSEIISKLNQLIGKANKGIVLSEGVSAVIIGPPNAGKSTLLNFLTGEETAIVSDIPGTTRDIIKARINIGGVVLNIIDTAGVRDTKDEIEHLGISKALKSASNASMVILMCDVGENSEYFQNMIQEHTFNNSKIVKVVNKVDTLAQEQNTRQNLDGDVYFVSAKSGQGIEKLKAGMKDLVMGNQSSSSDIVAKSRHIFSLKNCLKHVFLSQDAHNQGFSDIAAEELRTSHLFLQKITGEFNTEDMLGEIFSSFCIGK